jgi:pilus assembly protein Flp/PilA
MSNAVVRLWRDESGATAIEYGLIAALMAVACIAAFISLGHGLMGLFNSVESRANSAMAGSGG